MTKTTKNSKALDINSVAMAQATLPANQDADYSAYLLWKKNGGKVTTVPTIEPKSITHSVHESKAGNKMVKVTKPTESLHANAKDFVIYLPSDLLNYIVSNAKTLQALSAKCDKENE